MPEQRTAYAAVDRQSERVERSQDEINEVVNRLAERLRDGQQTERSDAGAPAARAGAGLSLEEFVQAATDSVLRAVDAREKRLGEERGIPVQHLALRIPPIWFGLVIGQPIAQVGAEPEGRPRQ